MKDSSDESIKEKLTACNKIHLYYVVGTSSSTAGESQRELLQKLWNVDHCQFYVMVENYFFMRGGLKLQAIKDEVPDYKQHANKSYHLVTLLGILKFCNQIHILIWVVDTWDDNSLRSSGGSLTMASGDGNTSGGSVNIEGGDSATNLGRYITISSGVGTGTSSGYTAMSMSNAGVSSGVCQVICVWVNCHH
jgi:hypothetical protein